MTRDDASAAAPQPPQPQPPPSLQRLLEQLEAANGGAPDAEARQALATLSAVMAESERAVSGGGEAAASATTTTGVSAAAVAAAAAAAASAAEAQAAAAAAAAEDLAARVSALESRIEGLAPETTAIVAEALAETMKEESGGEEQEAL